MGSIRSFMQDASAVEQQVRAGTAKRVLRFAAPYTGLLAVFLSVVILDTGIGIVNPLIYRHIINDGILQGDAALVIRFAVLAGVLGLLNTALGLAQSYLSATIGARVVLSLRKKLFDHIQQMPLAFFTRVRTGALVSRLNTDVAGAQNAFTDLSSNVIGNGVTLILILGAMFALSWPVTLAALTLVPLFILPVRYWGRKLQAIMRESFHLTGAVSSLMIERFNVAGVQEAFETALRGHTSIVIAHRLSTIHKADQILVLNEGRIVERGTHAELIQRHGLYAELYERQFASPTLAV